MKKLLSQHILLAIFLVGHASTSTADETTLSLAGTWRLRLDAEDVGVAKQWHLQDFEDTVQLPGTTDENGKGIRKDEQCIDRLSRVWYWKGPAWYQRRVTIPDAWRQKRITLILERSKHTRVWVDKTFLDWEDTLSAPQIFDVTAAMTPGEHTITVLVDNARLPPVGPSHAVDERTQTNWNSIVGRIELRATAPVWLEDVQVYPDIESKQALVRAMIGNITGQAATGQITVACETTMSTSPQHSSPNWSSLMPLSVRTAGWADERAVTGTRKSVKELQEEFLKLKFGMFIHYNLATYKNVEWVAGYHSPADFNPGVETIDTDAWADAAVSAGMQYGVLTVKHVAGFCLWDSKYTTYDVMHPDCPYQKDLVAQFINSFKSRGLKVGLYYCWRHPGFDKGRNRGKFKVLPPECDPATHSLEEQIEFQKKQIAELAEKYPGVFYIWNDALDDRIMPADEAQTFVRRLRQDIIASSNWWDWGKKGMPFVDIAVKEMRHFPEDNTAPGETCWKLEQAWFWKEGARAKTAEQTLDLLGKVNSRNSNFLLNVGPDRDGRIIESSIKTLAEIESH